MPDGTGPRRVLIVTPYYAPHVGGVERYVESLVHELRAGTSWEPVVVTTGGPGEASCRRDDDGTRVYRLARTGRVSNTPIGVHWPRELARVIERERPRLVNAHAPVPGLADLAARVAGPVPFVLTYHTGPMRKDGVVKDRLVRAYQRHVLPGTLARADAVITSSDYVREALPGPHPRTAVTVHPGVDLTRFTPGAGPADPGVTALFVGALDTAAAYKNLPGLLRALKLLADAGLTVPLAVAGDGDGLPGHRRLAEELGLPVSFAGTLTGDALLDAYRRASMLVLPTLFDSFGTVLAEAMATGTPVIASATGGVPELVTHDVDGLLVPPGDVGRLAAAVGTLAGDAALRERLGAAARRHIVTRLGWARQAGLVTDVFERVLAGAQPRGNQANRGQPHRPQSVPLRR